MRWLAGQRGALRSGVILGVLTIGVSTAAISACVGDDPSAATSSDDAGNDASSDAIAAGDGTTPGDSAVTPDGGIAVVDVSSGFNNSCALLADGTVWCWGGDDLGQLGVSSASLSAVAGCQGPCDPVAHKIAFPAGVQIAQVSADNHSCAVDKAGDVYCWGRNQYGELGHAPNASGSGDAPCAPSGATCNITPQKVVGIADVLKVEVGDYETCALTTGHAVYCWGWNDTFALGDPTELDAAFSMSTPAQVAALTGKTITDLDLSRNASHVCAISEGEGVWCWGFNNYGQLGHNAGTGTPADIISSAASAYGNATPQLVANTPYAIHVAAAQGVSCGSTDGGTAGCWGSNQQGQFGNGTFTPNGVDSPLSQADGDAGNIAIIVGGGGSASGVLCTIGNDSHLSCWGATDYGEVGNGAYNQVDAAAAFDAGPVCNGTHCVDVPQTLPLLAKSASVGFVGSLALGTDGKVYAWGYNNYAQLGHAPFTSGDRNACGTGRPADGSGACNAAPVAVGGLP
jgi:alpha-tubulin suppressor-like RCC1 family protein